MKIINKTPWKTLDLKRFVERAGREEFDDKWPRRKRLLTITFKAWRPYNAHGNGEVGGYAYFIHWSGPDPPRR